MKLNVRQVCAAKLREKAYKLADGAGSRCAVQQHVLVSGA